MGGWQYRMEGEGVDRNGVRSRQRREVEVCGCRTCVKSMLYHEHMFPSTCSHAIIFPTLPRSVSLSLSLSCFLHSPFSPSSTHITLVPAQVSASPTTSAVIEGSRAQFEFTVRGSPFPTVEWFKTNIGDSFRINPVSPQLENGERLVACRKRREGD